MKKLFLAVLLTALPSFATVAVTVNVKSIAVTVPTSAVTVRFSLQNCAAGNPRIIGSGMLEQTSYDFRANSSGVASGTIYGNDEIDCSGYQNTVYAVEYLVNGIPLAQAFTYVICAGNGGTCSSTGGAFNPATATPTSAVPAVFPPSGDNTYFRLDGGNTSSANYPGLAAGHFAFNNRDNAFTAVQSGVDPTSALNFTTKEYVDGSTRASVIAYGAKGDSVTDDTTAFQNAINASRSVFIPNNAPGKCYLINGVTIAQSTTIELESRNTCIEPLNVATPYLFYIEGTSIASPVAAVTIKGNNGILYAPFSMNAGGTGIQIHYGSHINLENLIVNGFDYNINVDNTFYLDLDRVQSNGATYANFWHQHSDVSHGPYFGGPDVIRGGTFDSTTGPYSIHVTDVAVFDMDGVDVVGVPNGIGAYFNTSNGIGGSPPDYASGIHISNSTFDTTGSEALNILNYTKSTIEGSWFSGGRTNSKDCISLQGVQNVSVVGNHVFWCGLDGIGVGGNSFQVTVVGNSAAGSPGDGIHFALTANSKATGNDCNSHTFNGSGVAQAWCVYEEPASSNDTFIGNDTGDTTYGNGFNGQNAMWFDATQGIQTGGSAVVQSAVSTGAFEANSITLQGDPAPSSAGNISLGGTVVTCPTWTGFTPPTGTLCAKALAQGSSNAYYTLVFPAGTGGVSGYPSWWPSIPSTATVFSNLQNSGGNPGTWTICDANNLCSAGTPNALGAASNTFGVTSPSQSGSALEFQNSIASGTVNTSGNNITWVSGTLFNTAWSGHGVPIKINGTTYTIATVTDSTHMTTSAPAGTQTGVSYISSTGSNSLDYRHLGSSFSCGSGCTNTSTTITNMTEDFYVRPVPGANSTGFEYDPDLGTGTAAYKASIACYASTNTWYVYDSFNHAWVNTTYACNFNGAGANAWHHVQLWTTYDHGAQQYTYKGLAVDGSDVFTPTVHMATVTYGACTASPACSGNTSLGSNVNIEMQLDDTSAAGTMAEYIDKLTLTVW